MKERTIHSERIYNGKVIDVYVDEVEIGDKTSKREIVKHRGAVCALALTSDRRIVLVRQFRKATEEFLLEIPAGKLEIGEEPQTAILREIKEETGYEVEKIEYITEFYTSPGFSNERIHLYFAMLGAAGETDFDEGEDIEIVLCEKEEALEWIMQGKIKDAKTIAAISLFLTKERTHP